MDRKKPKLTSPWKVGFLVALLMVVTALGVSYFITGTFAITWHWIQIGGPSPSTWTFNLGAFVEEMVPLLLVTSLLAFGSHVLVAGAVRRYKAYVDSGADYKQLLKSIKSVENLDDEEITDQLKQHPELREFLMKVKHRVAARERQHGERDKKHPGGSAPARENRPALAQEAATLAGAIVAGPAGFAQDLGLTTPELKQVERAVRSSFASAPAPATPVATAAPSSGELDALRASLGDTVAALRRDMIACGAGAREVEAALALLRTELQENVARPSGPANAPVIQKRVDAIADALGALGEETKRIAIASALQASGGPDGANIQVAEELRTIATRFNTVAQYWRETTPAVKQALEASAAGTDPRNAIFAATVATAQNKASLWGERTVAMNEHMRALERAVGVGAAPDATPDAHATDSDDLDIAPRAAAAPAPAPEPDLVDGTDEIVTQTAANVFATDAPEDAAFADIPGFEKERKFFADPSRGAAEPDDRFVVDAKEGQRWDLSEGEEAESAPETPEIPETPETPAPAARQPAAAPDGFLTGPRPTVSPKRTEKPAAPSVPRMPGFEATAIPSAASSSSSTATLDPDADAVDLYALGAIDAVV